MKKPTAYVSRSGHKLSLNCDERASNSGFLNLLAYSPNISLLLILIFNTKVKIRDE